MIYNLAAEIIANLCFGDIRIIVAKAWAYSISFPAKNPFLLPSDSTIISDFGPPDLWATVISPAAKHSTTPSIQKK